MMIEDQMAALKAEIAEMRGESSGQRNGRNGYVRADRLVIPITLIGGIIAAVAFLVWDRAQIDQRFQAQQARFDAEISAQAAAMEKGFADVATSLGQLGDTLRGSIAALETRTDDRYTRSDAIRDCLFMDIANPAFECPVIVYSSSAHASFEIDRRALARAGRIDEQASNGS